MWWEVVYWIGALSGIGCVYDLFARQRAAAWSGTRRMGLAVGILLLSWAGIGAYWLWIRKRIA